MPNIAEYTAQGDITPTDRGIQAAEIAGRRIGLYGHQLAGDVKEVTGAVEQHMTVMEASELYKTGTELRINLQKRYDEESALPENRNDPHFGDRFMSEVGPLIDQWGAGARTDHGKQLATELGSNMRREIFQHVTAGQSEMDMAHVDDNAKQTGNMLGGGLILDPSEGNLNRSLGTMKDAVDAMTMSIPDVAMRERVATELKNQYLPQLVMARYQGVAESTKNQVAATGDETGSPALAQLNKDFAGQLGFERLTPEQQARLPELRDEAVRQGKELYKAKDATQRRQQDEAVDSALLNVETSMFKPNGAGGVTFAATPEALAAVQQIAKMPGAERAASKFEALMNAMHTATQDQIDGKERVTDRATGQAFYSRIGNEKDPLTKAEVDEAYYKGKLSKDDWSYFRTSAADSKLATPKQTHAFSELNHGLELIKPLLDNSNPLLGKLDTRGAQNYAYLSYFAGQAVRSAIQAGTDPHAAVQNLLNPNNPHGLWPQVRRMQAESAGDKKGMAAAMQAITHGTQPVVAPPAAHTPAPPPALKGETPDAYLKRTGG